MSDVSVIYSLLCQAVSSLPPSSPQSQQQALSTLQSFESENPSAVVISTLTILSEASLSAQSLSIADRDVRQLAVLCLKNVVRNRWIVRTAGAATVSDDVKDTLRQFLLTKALQEADERVLVQLTSLTAKVARHDWPKQWPLLLPSLFSVASSSPIINQSVDANVVPNSIVAMGTMLEILTELTSKRLGVDRDRLRESCVTMFDPLATLWRALAVSFQSLLLQISTASAAQLIAIDVNVMRLTENIFLASKLLYTVVKEAFPSLASSTLLSQLFGEVVHLNQVFATFLRSAQKLGIRISGKNSSRASIVDDGEEEEEYYQQLCNRVEELGGLGFSLAIREGLCEDSVGDNGLAVGPLSLAAVRMMLKDMVGLAPQLLEQYALDMSPFLQLFMEFSMTQLHEEFGGAVPQRSSASASLGVACALFLAKLLSCKQYCNSEEAFDRELGRRKRVEMMGRRLNKGLVAASSSSSSLSLTSEEREHERERDAEQELQQLKAASAHGYAVRESMFKDASSSSQNKINSFISLVIERLLVLPFTDIVQWAREPEQYVVQQEALTENDSLHTAAESLFLALAELFPEAVYGVIVSHVQNIPRQMSALSQCTGSMCISSTADPRTQELLFWDAVYRCVGISVCKLSSYFSGPSGWLQTTIGPLLSSLLNDSGGSGAGVLTVALEDDDDELLFVHILRRRLLWLLSCCSYLLDENTVPVIIDIMTGILEAASSGDESKRDLVTGLQAINTLRSLLQVDSFHPQMLVASFPRLLSALCSLSSSMEEGENSALAVELLGEIIIKLGVLLRPILGELVSHQLSLWNSCNTSKASMRPTILTVLSRIVRVAGAESASIQTPLLRLLREVFLTGSSSSNHGSGHEDDGTAASSASLLNEAFTLWLVLLRNATVYSAEFETLFNEAYRILFKLHAAEDEGQFAQSDGLRTVLLLLESYAILGGLRFLTACSPAIVSCYESLLCETHQRYVPVVVRPLEALFFRCPAETAMFMQQSGLLAKMLQPLAADMSGLMSAIPALEAHKEPDQSLVHYLSVCARLLISDNGIGVQVLEAAAAAMFTALSPALLASSPSLVGQFVQQLVRMLIDKFDAAGGQAGGQWRKKLWCAALLTLYPSNDEQLLHWLPEVVTLTDSYLAEACEDEVDRTQQQYFASLAGAMVSTAIDDEERDDETTVGAELEPAVAIFQDILSKDAVSTLDMKQLVVQKLLAVYSSFLGTANGHGRFAELMRPLAIDSNGSISSESYSAFLHSQAHK